MLTNSTTQRAVAGLDIPLVLAGSNGFFSLTLNADTVYKSVGAGLYLLITSAAHNLATGSTKCGYITTAQAIGVLLDGCGVITLSTTSLTSTLGPIPLVLFANFISQGGNRNQADYKNDDQEKCQQFLFHFISSILILSLIH